MYIDVNFYADNSKIHMSSQVFNWECFFFAKEGMKELPVFPYLDRAKIETDAKCQMTVFFFALTNFSKFSHERFLKYVYEAPC